MVASIFVIQGYETFRRPERVAPRAEPVVRPLAERIPAVPAKTEDAVRLNGAVQMVAGRCWRWAGSRGCPRSRWPGRWCRPPLAGHRFWEAEEEADRAQQRIHFLKNLSMLGGLLITAADTAGNPSLAWRPARRQDGPPGGVPGRRTAKASGKAGRR